MTSLTSSKVTAELTAYNKVMIAMNNARDAYKASTEAACKAFDAYVTAEAAYWRAISDSELTAKAAAADACTGTGETANYVDLKARADVEDACDEAYTKAYVTTESE